MPDSWSLWVVIGVCVAAGYGVTSRLIDAWHARNAGRELRPPGAAGTGAGRPAGTATRAPGEEDCFAVLGLAPGADEQAVRDAYRRLVRQYHPDKVSGLGPELLEVAERETRRINSAYEEALERIRDR